MSMIGNISEFCNETESFIEWVERLEQWYVANSIEDSVKKRALFLSLIGAKGYKLIRSLAQNQPSSKSYDELKKLMTDHLQPKPNEIAQRYMFYKRNRREDESIKDYVAELRKLSEHCNFGEKLNESIRDKLVCGLNKEKIQQKLLATQDLDLQTAIYTAIAMEAAAESAKELHGGISSFGGNSSGAVYRVGNEKGNNNIGSTGGDDRGSVYALRKECFRCGSNRHLADGCPFKNRECFACKQVGHIRKKCHSSSSRRKSSNGSSFNQGRNMSNNRYSCNQASVDYGTENNKIDGELDSGMNFLNLYALGTERNDPVWVDMELNDKTVKMEVDTGAAVSVMSTRSFTSVKGGRLAPCDLNLRTYTGELVRPKGVGKLKVAYKGQKFMLPIVVLDGNVPTLLGRDWLNKITLNWEELFQVKIHKVDVEGKVEDLKRKYPEVFGEKLGCLKDFKVHIPVPEDAKPVYWKPRSVPFALRARVDKELDKLEEQGIWKKVEYSRWAAPIVPVLKDSKNVDGPVRICGDYKVTVNKVAPLDNYPIPNTSEQLATLAGGQRFTKIDLSQAYQQLELDDFTKELLTINTHRGLYQPDRLQYGVHSATGIFQREMDKRLSGIELVKVRVDDVLISGRNDKEHWEAVDEVLRRLAEAGLTVNLSKCFFFQDEVTYCGYRISKEGVQPLKENVEAVQKAPEPKNVSELRSYLGMLNYYQSYLPGLASKSEPLHELLRKGNTWKWGQVQTGAFEVTKKMLSEAPLLVHFNPALEILVHADASPYGLGAVLSHIMEDGSERPVCYASRTLSVAERNYGHVEKEGLALVFAVKKFHHYLFGHKFKMVTDHKPLLGLFSEHKGLPDRAASRILRWALLLAGYDYKLEYRPGIKHCNADGLSRLPLEAQNDDISRSKAVIHMMELARAPISESEVREETRKDSILATVLHRVLNGWTGEDKTSKDLKPYYMHKEELSAEGGCVLWGRRVIIPKIIRRRILEELHEVHMGISRMKSLARSFCWWPGMDMDIENKVRHCYKCQQNRNNPSAAQPHSWEYPSAAWERLHIDFAGPFMGKMFLIVVDAFSKWIEVESMSSSTSSATVRCLRKIFSTHGLPRVMVSDNGRAFLGHEFKEFLKKNGVRHILAAPYHPASNGQVERMVRTFKESLKALSHGEIDTKLSRFLFRYRITPHTATGKTPAELLMKRELRSAFVQLRPNKQNRTVDRQMDGGQQNCKNVREFQRGDLVWAKNFGRGARWLSGRISKRIGTVNYEVETSEDTLVHRHIDQLLKREMEFNKLPDVEEVLDIGEEVVRKPETNNMSKEIGGSVTHEETSEIEDMGSGIGDGDDLKKTEVESKETLETPVVRRSIRSYKKPGWLTEYVVNRLEGEDCCRVLHTLQ